MFSYERSVNYPEGHRNVVFAQRGIRVLPRLPLSAEDNPAPAPDTQMLYRYLRQFDGIVASHTFGHRPWAPTGATTIRWSSRWSRSTRATARITRCRVRRAPTAADNSIGGWRAAGLRVAGAQERLSPRLPGFERSRFHPHVLLQSVGDQPDARRHHGSLPQAAHLRRHRRHPGRRALRQSFHGRRFRHRPSRRRFR